MQEVEREKQDVIQLNGGQVYPLGVVTDGHREYKARFVSAGKVRGKGNQSSAIQLEAGALMKAVIDELFIRKAVFIDHASLHAQPSLDRLAGVTIYAEWDHSQQAVEGIIRLHNTATGRLAAELIDELLRHPESAPDVGLSLVCYPLFQRQDDCLIVSKINYIESVDLVFEPAAEGRLLAALSSENLENWQAVALSKGDKTMNEKQENRVLEKETQSVVLPKEIAAEQAHLPGMETKYQNQNAAQDTPDQQHTAQDWLQALQNSTIQSMINASGLPAVSQERLASGDYSSPDQVYRAIDEERVYLAQLQQDQVIQLESVPPRGAQISGMLNEVDRLEIALEALMAGVRPKEGIKPLTGIREFYHQLSGDYEMTGLFNAERLNLANVNSSTMSNIVANVLNKRVVNEFQQYPRWWEPICTMEDFHSLQQVKWITLGGVGELPTVSEGAAYSELSWDDNAETATFVKKGGYLGITLETIDKDDTARIRTAPKALAQAAWLTLSKSVSAIFTDNSGVGPTMADGDALFHTNHSNLGTTALSLTEWEVVKLAMRKQTELNSGERLGGLVSPKYLLVPPDLENTALQILASEYQYTYALSNGTTAPINPNALGNGFNERLQNARERVVVVDLWTDTNNWAVGADPRLYPTIGLAFRYGRTPEIFSVASPTAGLMFSNDTLPVKVRFFYATGPMDYRGLYKENVA
jgi:hypothetical protein